MNIITDKDLVSIPEMTNRINSIEDQIDRQNAIVDYKDFNQHHNKIKKLVARRDALWVRRALLIKAGNITER